MGVAGALAFVHQQGVLHLDIHGGNIFLTSCGDNTVACLADFGMAFVLEDVEAQTPGFCVHPEVNRAPELFFAPGASLKNKVHAPTKYTLEYVPPRAIAKALYTGALDVWALGCVMHFAEHGQYLFHGGKDPNYLSAPPPRSQEAKTPPIDHGAQNEEDEGPPPHR